MGGVPNVSMQLGLLFELGYEVFELGEMAQIDTQRTLPKKNLKKI